MPDEDIIRELNRRVAALTEKNADLQGTLLDAFVALARSAPLEGNQQFHDQVLNQIVGVLGLTDGDINSLLES